EGQPAADLDPAVHLQLHRRRQRDAGADSRGQVALYGLREPGDFFPAERARRRGTAQAPFPVRYSGPCHAGPAYVCPAFRGAIDGALLSARSLIPRSIRWVITKLMT